jgi:phosphonate transport system ATP-binding protein
MEGICKKYSEQRVLCNISLSIEKGENVAILGASGSGKTTLTRIINGFEKPEDGKIYFDDEYISYKSKNYLRCLRKRIGVIYQTFNLVERTPVLHNVLTGCLGRMDNSIEFLSSIIGIFRKNNIERAKEIIRFVELEGKTIERVDRLSGGEKQRVAIARALMQNPDLLIADEPIANLDPRTSQKIMELLLRINKEKHITLIAVLHNVKVAQAFFDRIVAIKDAGIFFDGPTEKLNVEDFKELYDVQDDSCQYEYGLAI